MLINADKCNKSVLIYKNDYHSKMLEMLNDGNTYKKITKDPTNSTQTKINKMVSKWQ